MTPRSVGHHNSPSKSKAASNLSDVNIINWGHRAIMNKSALSAFYILWILLPDSYPLGAHAWPSSSSSPPPPPRKPIFVATSMLKTRGVGRTRLRNKSKVFASNVLPTSTVVTTIDEGISWDGNEENDQEELLMIEQMTVSELKDRLRSIGQKVRSGW